MARTMLASAISKAAKAASFIAAAATAAILYAEISSDAHTTTSPRFRAASKRRQRDSFEDVTRWLSSAEFQCAFRLSRCTFYHLLRLVKTQLCRDASHASCSSGGAIEPAVRLAVTLRILAGGSYHDQIMYWRLGRSTVYSVFHDTIFSINSVLKMPGVPLHDADALDKLATGFNTSRSPPNPLWGCVGALDGIAIAITKPPDDYVPRNFYCRKGMYDLPVQAVVYSHYRFLFMSCKCVGSTHDSVAFYVSSLARRLRNGEMPSGFWLAGDPAYTCCYGLMTPWTQSMLRDEEDGIYRDAFNFYRSSCRIHVEQAFGMLVKRWGIFWRPISYNIVEALPILSAAMRLHNFAIDNGDSHLSYQSPAEVQMSNVAFQKWWGCASELREVIEESMRDLETQSLRELVTKSLKERGITRPATS